MIGGIDTQAEGYATLGSLQTRAEGKETRKSVQYAALRVLNSKRGGGVSRSNSIERLDNSANDRIAIPSCRVAARYVGVSPSSFVLSLASVVRPIVFRSDVLVSVALFSRGSGIDRAERGWTRMW